MLTILLTGATDGIGLETAKRLVAQGHRVLVHGRSKSKLESTAAMLGKENVETYRCDLSKLADVRTMAQQVSAKHEKLDVVIHNAGVLKSNSPRTADGLDIRFAVNTIAPYLLTVLLWPLLFSSSRVVNISSAAQASVDLNALAGNVPISDWSAYSQSKTGIAMWSTHLAKTRAKKNGPLLIALNPGSMLSTNMVKDAMPGAPPKDVGIGADIIIRAALSDEFADKSGWYYDNDYKTFDTPHPDANDPRKCQALVDTMEEVLEKLGIDLTCDVTE